MKRILFLVLFEVTLSHHIFASQSNQHTPNHASLSLTWIQVYDEEIFDTIAPIDKQTFQTLFNRFIEIQDNLQRKKWSLSKGLHLLKELETQSQFFLTDKESQERFTVPLQSVIESYQKQMRR